jgi:hypothetical protein
MTEARSFLQQSPESRAASCRSALHRVDAKGLGPRPALVAKFLARSAITCALALAGCASNSAQRESNAIPPIYAAAPAHQRESKAVTPIYAAAPPHRRESKAVTPIHAAAPLHRYSELRIRRRALLAPPPAPNCTLSGFDDLKPVDPDQWERMKLDYERQCYQQAEQMVRDQLRLLQAASKCEIEPVRHSQRLIQ